MVIIHGIMRETARLLTPDMFCFCRRNCQGARVASTTLYEVDECSQESAEEENTEQQVRKPTRTA